MIDRSCGHFSFIVMSSIVCRVFQHYKNNLYGRMFERDLPGTCEKVVVYRVLGTADTWCRPRGMFYDPGCFKDMGHNTLLVVHDGTVVRHTETGKSYKLSPGAWQLVEE